MVMRVTRERSILGNQKTSIGITINTTFRFKPFINYGNECLGSHNRDDVVLKKRTIDIHVKKDDNYEVKLRDYEKENACYRIRDQIVKKIL